MTGGRSHYMNILKIGQELISRGLKFSVLVSTSDTVTYETLAAIPGLKVYTFDGPPDIGTERWAYHKTPRQVCRRHCMAKRKQFGPAAVSTRMYTNNFPLLKITI